MVSDTMIIPRESPKPDPPPHENAILNTLRAIVIILNLFGFGNPYVFNLVAAGITVRLLWVALHRFSFLGERLLGRVALVVDLFILGWLGFSQVVMYV